MNDIAEKFQQLVKKTEQDAQDRLPRAADLLKQEVVRLISHQGSKDSHSQPGQAPFRQTGELVDSIFVEVHDGEIVVGSHAPYASFVAKKRPFLELAYQNVQNQMKEIILEGK